MTLKDNELIKKWLVLKSEHNLVQMFRYAIVGGTAAVVDISILYFITETFNINPLISNIISCFIFGLATNYILSILWVFPKGKYKRHFEFFSFAMIGVIGFGWNELLLLLAYEIIGLHYIIGKIIATGFVFFWNFFVRKYLLFNSKKDKEKEIQNSL